MNDNPRCVPRMPPACMPMYASLAILSFSGACAAPSPDTVAASASAPDPVVAAIQQAVNLTYEVSSFEDATTTDPEAFRAAFTPTAKLAYVSAGRLVERSVDEYVEIRRQIMASGEVDALNEWEVLGRTEYFGNIAQHFSTYSVRVNGEEAVVERGVMSFQLMKVGNRWLVHSLTWQAETDELLLPSSVWPPEPQ